ncbi:hypothetical protein FS749_004274 [Ceratobasidium sp. UAMH 11750]|nr:hypothetical protein FS749_004274 [Ceratobasidium sp. UAMH 11750]
MHIPTGYRHAAGNLFHARAIHSPVVRDIPGADQSNALTPTMIVGICLAVVSAAGMGLFVFVHWYRKRARAARTMERGVKAARASVAERTKAKMQEAWREGAGGNASDDTHVVDFAYGDKVRSSFESSDYGALSTHKGKSALQATNLVLRTPSARARPNLTAIDVQRANRSTSPLASSRAFPTAPSSVQSFYGPAIARARAGSIAHEQGPVQGQSSAQGQGLAATSAIRALAVAAGVAPPADGEKTAEPEKETFDLSVGFTPFRVSTFGGGMGLGEHLGIRVEDKGRPESEWSQDNRLSHASSPVRAEESRIVPPSPGVRPGTAGTFGEPVGSFAGRIPYKAMGHRHAASSLSIADVRSVRVSYASGLASPMSAAFKGHSPKPSFSHGRTQSSGSATGVSTRRVQTLFPPLLPDELVLSVGEKVTLLQTFDDEWCVVGRDRFGEVEIGAVPAFVFTKAKSGATFARPMRNTSLGVKVEMSSAPGAVWSSREEVISWSNF